MNTISARRLRKLADFLDTLPPERFHYGTWVGANWRGDPDLSCGTTACALGWAATMPEFRKLGLYLTTYCPVVTTGARVLRGENAAAFIFRLSPDEAVYLFIPNAPHPTNRRRRAPLASASAHTVARHIRRYVEGWEASR